MMAMSKEEAAKILNKVMERSSMEEDYRQLALEDPKKAIEEEAGGVELPEDYKISFLEGDPEADETFVLPPLKSELSDEDLDDVAGGFCLVKGCKLKF